MTGIQPPLRILGSQHPKEQVFHPSFLEGSMILRAIANMFHQPHFTVHSEERVKSLEIITTHILTGNKPCLHQSTTFLGMWFVYHSAPSFDPQHDKLVINNLRIQLLYKESIIEKKGPGYHVNNLNVETFTDLLLFTVVVGFNPSVYTKIHQILYSW